MVMWILIIFCRSSHLASNDDIDHCLMIGDKWCHQRCFKHSTTTLQYWHRNVLSSDIPSLCCFLGNITTILVLQFPAYAPALPHATPNISSRETTSHKQGFYTSWFYRAGARTEKGQYQPRSLRSCMILYFQTTHCYHEIQIPGNNSKTYKNPSFHTKVNEKTHEVNAVNNIKHKWGGEFSQYRN